MNSVSKLKIALSYTLLLAVLLGSLLFVHQEVETLTHSEEQDVQWTDSLLSLLRKKDANTIHMLRTLNEAKDSMVSTQEIEHIIAEQDSIVVQQRVQRRVITHRDTIVTPKRHPKKKKRGFFKRLGDLFSPPKEEEPEDTMMQVKTSLEFAVDTIIESYSPVDSLQQKLKAVAQQKRKGRIVIHRRNQSLQRMDQLLTERIDSLLKGYEQNTLERGRKAAEQQKLIRSRSARTIGGIAIGAVLLAALFLILIGRDVTRSNRYKRELEEERRHAEELLATREKLMLAITHDFKAPLGSIMGYADLLSHLITDGRQLFYLNNMKLSSEHLLKLVVDLLDFHRLDLHKAEVNRVTFQPAELLEEIYVSFKPLTAAKGLDLQSEISPLLKQNYICDPLRLRQIINNLLSNAVKFTDRGGITLSARYEDRKLVVAVTDTGRGMPPADCERIFQEFTRLPGAQGKEGFGLGLSIVRMLVQLLEGSIKVDSELDKGSTFTIRIPIYPVQGNVTSSAVKAPPACESQLAVHKVLLIDDDRIQLTLTSSMLSNSGIDSVTCLEVDELLDALRTDTFDLLLTDVQMPAITGFDLLNLLRASNIPQARTIPVIAVTARSDMERNDFLAHGFMGCLHKPFTVKELLKEVNVAGTETPAVAATHQSVESAVYDFAALTAFSAGDAEATASIIESYASETKANSERLSQSNEAQNVEEIAAVAHKMIPICTLIKATELVAVLRQLEQARHQSYSEEIGASVKLVLHQIERMEQALEEWRKQQE